ncbi:MAG: hypothetical protein WDZ35_03400 [Crocinitomicaceae bacterium]
MKNLIIILLLLSSGTAFAQVNESDEICNAYDSLLAKAVKEGDVTHISQLNIKTTLIKRAIGPVAHEINIYFDEFEIIHEDDQFPPEKKAAIRKVKFSINAGSYTIQYQYYFDKKGGLIKYNEVEIGYECIIRNIYYKKDAPVRITLKPTNRGCLPEDRVKPYDKTDLSKKDKLKAATALKEANQFKELLKLNYELLR